MGLFDFLFGKKVTLEIPDQRGNIVKRKISKKMFDEMIAKGDLQRADTVKAHILDPNRGYYSAHWIVGEDISKEDVEKFATPSSEIYVAVAYKGGEPNIIITTKEIWDKQRSIFDMIDKGEDYEDALDAHLSNLKDKIIEEKDRVIREKEETE